MVMADLIRGLENEVGVAHMNFQLRGNDSDQDEELVRNWCSQNKIVFYANKTKLTGETSTQMEARDQRYKWFMELCEEHGYTKILTAHHLDDSLETVLLNLTKGTGINGLVGIPDGNGNVVRPMLDFTKKEITEYAEKNGVSWREDRTNETCDYQRNLIRNEVVPVLQKINPSLEQTYKRTNQRIIGTSEIIAQKVSELGIEIDWESQPIVIPMEWITGSISDRVLLYEMLKPIKVSDFVVEEILATKESGRVFEVGEWTICKDREQLVISRNDFEDTKVEIHQPGKFDWRNLEILVETIPKGSMASDAEIGQFEAEDLEFPIKVRSWKDGDHFVPLGMSGKKKLSDFMIDQKIPRTLKKNIPIFENKNGEIFWVGGYRIDDRFKVKDGDQKIIQITIGER